MTTATVELVVGLDTFQPISTEDPLDHPMHTERYRVPEATMQACREADRVVAVGTTAVRALESAAARGELSGRTDIFIHRGFDWQVVDVLMTNFHLPKTTLLMMIDAFVGASDGGACTPRRSPATTASCRSATPCCSTDEPPEHPVSVVRCIGWTWRSTASTARRGPARRRRRGGSYTTPLFMPVGTRAAIKYLSADDYEQVGAQIVLGNTYHLMLRPGRRRSSNASAGWGSSPAGTA